MVSMLLFFVFTCVPFLFIVYSNLPIDAAIIQMVKWLLVNLFSLMGAAVAEFITGGFVEWLMIKLTRMR